MGLATIDPHGHKVQTKLCKIPSLVLIDPNVSKIQPFENVKIYKEMAMASGLGLSTSCSNFLKTFLQNSKSCSKNAPKSESCSKLLSMFQCKRLINNFNKEKQISTLHRYYVVSLNPNHENLILFREILAFSGVLYLAPLAATSKGSEYSSSSLELENGLSLGSAILSF